MSVLLQINTTTLEPHHKLHIYYTILYIQEIPVSYTHLDVYKRQDVNRTVNIENIKSIIFHLNQ